VDRGLRRPRNDGLANDAIGSYDGAVCTDDSPASLAAAMRHDVEPAVEIDLEPVDSVVVVTLMDNSTDALMADQGPARRADLGRSPRRSAALMADGHVPDALIAEH
jgi:7,8-dihydropterin-6-yl-methyl-4-(beta-D-ribofuranosyl)aminobenzene 5'-phosphate synthase